VSVQSSGDARGILEVEVAPRSQHDGNVTVDTGGRQSAAERAARAQDQQRRSATGDVIIDPDGVLAPRCRTAGSWMQQADAPPPPSCTCHHRVVRGRIRPAARELGQGGFARGGGADVEDPRLVHAFAGQQGVPAAIAEQRP